MIVSRTSLENAKADRIARAPRNLRRKLLTGIATGMTGAYVFYYIAASVAKEILK